MPCILIAFSHLNPMSLGLRCCTYSKSGGGLLIRGLLVYGTGEHREEVFDLPQEDKRGLLLSQRALDRNDKLRGVI
jgi:hypothetical protein